MAIKDKRPDLSIIIPVYNEEEHIGEIIERVKKLPLDKEIIVVDDGSVDRTHDVVSSFDQIKIMRHRTNMGKGTAIRTGLSIANGQWTIIQDADLEYSPEFIPTLLVDIKDDVIYGSRIKGGGRFLLMSYIANRFLSLLTSILYKTRISDMETCYKLVSTDLLKNLDLTARRFEIEPEITAKILRSGRQISEIPIAYQGRRKGKKIGPMDGFIAIWSLLKWRFKR